MEIAFTFFGVEDGGPVIGADYRTTGLPMTITSIIVATSISFGATDPIEAELVVEEARLDETEAFQTSASVTIVDVDERLAETENLASVIDRAAGIHVRRLGGADSFSGVSIRGSSTRQVQVHLDGIPLNPEGAESVNLSEWPLHAFDRVEIYRGNAPPHLAAAPMGGVVNLVTSDNAIPFTGAAGLGSEHQGLVSGLASVEGEIGGHKSDLMLFSETRTTRGDFEYFADNGTPYNLTDDRRIARLNNAKGQVGIHGRGRIRLNGWRLTLLDAFLARGEGIAGHINSPTTEARLDTSRNLAAIAVDRSFGSGRLKAHVWNLNREERYDDRANELGLDEQWVAQQTDTIGLTGHAEWFLAHGLVPGLTLSARRDRFGGSDLLQDQPIDSRSRLVGTSTFSAGIGEQVFRANPVAHATLLHSVEGSAEDQMSIDPRLGLSWTPLDTVSFRANGGRYIRPPDLTDLYGDRGSLIGNPDLRPERGWQWDVGVRHKAEVGKIGSLRLDLGHFWNAAQDRITFVQNSQWAMRPVNLGRTWVQGLEGTVGMALFEHLDTDTSASWIQSRNLRTAASVANKQLPGIPTWEIWHGTSLHWGQHVRLGHGYSYTAGNFLDATNWYKSTPRSLHQAFVRSRTWSRGPTMELAVNNLFDTIVEVVPRNPLNPEADGRMVAPLTDFAGHPLPGRTWMVTARWGQLGGAT